MTDRAARWANLPATDPTDALARVRTGMLYRVPEHLENLGAAVPPLMVETLDDLARLADYATEPAELHEFADRLAAGGNVTAADLAKRAAAADLALVAGMAYRSRATAARDVLTSLEPDVLAACRPAFTRALDMLDDLAGVLPDSTATTADSLLATGRADAAEQTYTVGRRALETIATIASVRSAFSTDWARLRYAWLRDDVEPITDDEGRPVVLTTGWSWPAVLGWVQYVRHHRDALWLPTAAEQAARANEVDELARKAARDSMRGRSFTFIGS